jgi:hypothetical protein
MTGKCANCDCDNCDENKVHIKISKPVLPSVQVSDNAEMLLQMTSVNVYGTTCEHAIFRTEDRMIHYHYTDGKGLMFNEFCGSFNQALSRMTRNLQHSRYTRFR